MRRLRVLLRAEICEVTGKLGLRPQGLRNLSFIPLDQGSGTILAHDLTEHVNGLAAIGGLEDELEAMGVYITTRHAIEDTVTKEGIFNELDDLFTAYKSLNREIPKARARPHPMDTTFTYMIDEAHHYISRYSDIPRLQWQRFKDLALTFMRRGVRKMERRYKDDNWPAHTALMDFYAVRDAVEKLTFEEGDKFILTLKEGECQIIHK